jgi:hypothetical protein
VEAMKVGDFAAITLAVLGDGLEHDLNVVIESIVVLPITS